MTRRAKITTVALAAATLALAAGPTMAQGGGMGMGMGMGMGNPDAPWRARFAAIDTDKSGAIDMAEMRSNAALVFAAMDANGDGKLTRDEYMAVRLGAQRGYNTSRQAAMQERKAARFAPMDTNRDGTVSEAEFVAHHADVLFAAMDRNGDGRITPTEFRRHRW